MSYAYQKHELVGQIEKEEKLRGTPDVSTRKATLFPEHFFHYAIPFWAFAAILIGLLLIPVSLPILIFKFLKKRRW